MNRLILLTLFLSTAGGFLCGQTVYRAAKIQATPTQFFQPGEILVEKGKIRAIGKSVKVPKKAKVVEWKDLEIYAGLISPGSSLGLTEINALRPTRDEREVGTHTPGRGSLGRGKPRLGTHPRSQSQWRDSFHYCPDGGHDFRTSGLITLDGWGVEEMTIRKKVALHLWWPGHSLGLPQPHAPANPRPSQLKNRKGKERKEFAKSTNSLIKPRHTGKGKKLTPTNWSKTPHGTP